MKLSKNLSLEEVIISNTAIKHGIDNTPNGTHLLALIALADNVFQPARNSLGVSIRVSSGYRSLELNIKIGGALSSQHSKGEALDLQIVNKSKNNADLFNFIKNNLDFDQMIWEFGSDDCPAWVHVSYKETGNRKQCLKAYKDSKNRTKYKVI
jgi:hypothetical protein